MSRSVTQIGIWVLSAGLAVSGLSVVTACGGSGANKPKFAKVKAQDMPEKGEWTGVFYSPVYGYPHPVKEGTNISGRWLTTRGAPGGERHTGTYPEATGDEQKQELERLHLACINGHTLGLHINAGHGLHRHNVQDVARLPHMTELHIGHSIIARSIFIGLEEAVREMADLIRL